MDNSNFDNFHGGGNFSHVYVIMYKYFGKKPKMQKMNTRFYICFLHEIFLHILLTLGATNFKASEYKKNKIQIA